MDVVTLLFAIDLRRRTQGLSIARRPCVDNVLDNRTVHHSERHNPEPERDTAYRLEANMAFAKQGEDHSIKDWDEDDDSDRVKVLHQVVGDTVAAHLKRLADEIGRELVVAYPEHGVDDEDLAGNQASLHLLDKLIIPFDCSVSASFGNPRRLRRI